MPAGSIEPQSVAFSHNGLGVATANAVSDDVTVFTLTGGLLNSGVSYPLLFGSQSPNSVAFSPDDLNLAVANRLTNNVTIFTTDCIISPNSSSSVTSDGGTGTGTSTGASSTFATSDGDGLSESSVAHSIFEGAIAYVLRHLNN